MNKYKKAFDTVNEVMIYYVGKEENLYSMKLLRELVDKSIPFTPTDKQIYYDGNYYGKCKCGEIVYDHYFNCYFCGQTLDWSKHE